MNIWKGGEKMLHEIGLTDYYFKEILTERRDYLLLLINGICHLNLTEKDILFGNIEERDEITFKTVMYDIKVVSQDINFDIEAQKNLVDKTKNEYGEYIYDVNRAIYYACMLHSRSLQYKESGYGKKKSIVIFIYLYDIPGKDAIQMSNMHNRCTGVEYDNVVIYSISLAKISKDSTIEVERALKLLSELDLTQYKNDKSNVIREAAGMIEGFDKSDIAMMKRDAKKKEEYELGHIKEMAIAEGKAEGKQEAIEENIRTMFEEGLNNETIARVLRLDISYVNEVLNK
jgi:predicted transposase/invertase (TIGR01784 family)